MTEPSIDRAPGHDRRCAPGAGTDADRVRIAARSRSALQRIPGNRGRRRRRHRARRRGHRLAGNLAHRLGPLRAGSKLALYRPPRGHSRSAPPGRCRGAHARRRNRSIALRRATKRRSRCARTSAATAPSSPHSATSSSGNAPTRAIPPSPPSACGNRFCKPTPLENRRPPGRRDGTLCPHATVTKPPLSPP